MRRHTTSDVPLHYLDLDPGTQTGQGDPVFLLHGLGSCAEDWRPQIDALGSGHRLIVPDLRGHGASPAPNGDWQIGDFANDLF
ncbi:MAG: alpha/beta fold hydrolase, partial [Janthinobacterium sp.]